MRRHDKDAFRLQLTPTELPTAPSEIIRLLRDVVTEERVERMRAIAARRTQKVVPVLEHLADPHNGAAIIRSADAFGVSDVHIVPGDEGFFVSRTVSRGTHRWLDLHAHNDSEACADALEAQGYEIFVASMEGTHGPEDLNQRGKVAVVFGNEHFGPSETMRARATGTYAIAMRGFVESLNVSVAAAITLHGIIGTSPPLLSAEEQEAVVARMLLRTVPSAQDVLESAGVEWTPKLL